MVHAELDWLDSDADQSQIHEVEWDTYSCEANESFVPANDVDELQAERADATTTEALCPNCGELLAWHDEYSTCVSSASRQALGAPSSFQAVVDEISQESDNETVMSQPRLFGRANPRADFAFEVGRSVYPISAEPAQVIWRGQLKERHPDTGLILRVNVYRLNDGYWDCYREEELQAA